MPTMLKWLANRKATTTSGATRYTSSYRPRSTSEKCPTSHVDSACVISYL